MMMKSGSDRNLASESILIGVKPDIFEYILSEIEEADHVKDDSVLGLTLEFQKQINKIKTAQSDGKLDDGKDLYKQELNKFIQDICEELEIPRRNHHKRSRSSRLQEDLAPPPAAPKRKRASYQSPYPPPPPPAQIVPPTGQLPIPPAVRRINPPAMRGGGGGAACKCHDDPNPRLKRLTEYLRGGGTKPKTRVSPGELDEDWTTIGENLYGNSKPINRQIRQFLLQLSRMPQLKYNPWASTFLGVPGSNLVDSLSELCKGAPVGKEKTISPKEEKQMRLGTYAGPKIVQSQPGLTQLCKFLASSNVSLKNIRNPTFRTWIGFLRNHQVRGGGGSYDPGWNRGQLLAQQMLEQNRFSFI